MNAGFPLLARGNIPLRLAWITGTGLALASVLIPLGKRPVLSLFSVFTLAVGFVYSGKPLYFSGRFVADFLANAVGYALIAFGAGWYLAGAPFGTAFFLSSVPYFFLMCAGSISSTLPDYEGDRKCGKKTTAVTLGVGPAHKIASLFIAAGFVSSLFLRDWTAALCSGCAVPLYVTFLIRNTARTMESTYKVGGMILMVGAALLYPFFAPASLLCLLITMVYFRMRFHVRYPSLIPGRPSA
jgi:4-hydroxybenzoate polyprenyltransferase